MNKIIRKFGLIVVATGFSNASVDVSAVTLNVDGVEVLAGVILGALAILWVAKKVVSFLSSDVDPYSSSNFDREAYDIEHAFDNHRENMEQDYYNNYKDT